MKKTFTTLSLTLLFITLLSTAPTTSQAQPLVVTVDGVNVNLDWSAMPTATSYTLYYALADYKGDIDIDTIGSIEMESNKNLYVSGLPSGLIIFVAILAHNTSQGDVPSNVEKFMGFSGTVTFPETGDVVMKVDDPGGIGNFSISGARDANGTATAITEIAYVGQTESFVMKIRDDKPYTITQDNVTTRFIYQADGSIAFEAVQANMAQSLSVLASLSTGNDSSLCDQYHDKAAYENDLRALPVFNDCRFGQKLENLHYPKYFEELAQKLEDLHYPKLFVKMVRRVWYGQDSAPTVFVLSLIAAQYNPNSDVVNAKIDLLFGYYRLVVESMEGVRDEMIEKKLAEYDRLCLPQCQLQISANGIHVNIPEKGNITLVSSCPIPSGAKCIEHGRTQSYVLNGHYVGPFTTWHSSGRQQASSIFCYDANGTKSWFISFNENDDDKAKYFAEFRNGDDMPSIEYHFYPNGCLKYSKYPDKSYYYSKNGTLLEECDFKQQSCTKYEGWTPRF